MWFVIQREHGDGPFHDFVKEAHLGVGNAATEIELKGAQIVFVAPDARAFEPLGAFIGGERPGFVGVHIRLLILQVCSCIVASLERVIALCAFLAKFGRQDFFAAAFARDDGRWLLYEPVLPATGHLALDAIAVGAVRSISHRLTSSF
jgi:hypothetical protein